MANIAVLGSGGWGTAISVMLNKHGHNVCLWSAFEQEILDIREDGENKKLLPGVPVSEEIMLTTDIGCAQDMDLIILAVPSFAVRETARKLRGIVKDGQIITVATKGFEKGTTNLLSDVLNEELPNVRVTVLSGPSHAEEVGRGVPTNVVSAANNEADAQYIQNLIMNKDFRIYTNLDLVGVELCGALKNVIALSWGICDGMELGDNTKAALVTRGLAEMTRIGLKMGAKPSTFSGLAGMGDLIVTCYSTHSRNHRFGILIGKGVPVEEALRLISMTVEGYYACASAVILADKLGVEIPIIRSCYDMLYNGKRPKYVLKELMERPQKSEENLF